MIKSLVFRRNLTQISSRIQSFHQLQSLRKPNERFYHANNKRFFSGNIDLDSNGIIQTENSGDLKPLVDLSDPTQNPLYGRHRPTSRERAQRKKQLRLERRQRRHQERLDSSMIKDRVNEAVVRMLPNGKYDCILYAFIELKIVVFKKICHIFEIVLKNLSKN